MRGRLVDLTHLRVDIAEPQMHGADFFFKLRLVLFVLIQVFVLLDPFENVFPCLRRLGILAGFIFDLALKLERQPGIRKGFH